MFDAYHSIFHHLYPLICALCFSHCPVICNAPRILTKTSYLSFDDSAGLLSKWHSFHANFFLLGESVFPSGINFWKTFCLVFSFPANLYLQSCRHSGNKSAHSETWRAVVLRRCWRKVLSEGYPSLDSEQVPYIWLFLLKTLMQTF